MRIIKVDKSNKTFIFEGNEILYENFIDGDEIYLDGELKPIFSYPPKAGRPNGKWYQIKELFGLVERKKGEKTTVDKRIKVRKQSSVGLFLELANVNDLGYSNWVSKESFIGKYKILGDKLGNGGGWCRDSGGLGRHYIVERKKSNDRGKPIIAIKLNGFRQDGFSNTIDKDIIVKLKVKPCVFTGIHHEIQIDHKNGRKNEVRVMSQQDQKEDDFQPTTRHMNTIKREICKKCKATNKRFDATSIGHKIATSIGSIEYEESVGCNGCYYYDPIKFIKEISKIIIKGD